MHNVIEYLGTPLEKQVTAMIDIIEWLGPERFKGITHNFRSTPEYNPTQFCSFLELAGISCYPATVYYEYLYGKPFPKEPTP